MRAYKAYIGLVLSTLWLVSAAQRPTHAAVNEAVPTGDAKNATRFEVGSGVLSRIPLPVPPFLGLEPQLSLVHILDSGDGLVGVGWHLAGFSSIQRIGETKGAPRYDQTDRFLLDGTDLVEDQSLGTETTQTHSTRIQSFERIHLDSQTDTWTVTQKDGTKRTYKPLWEGANGLAFRYPLTDVQDVHGNSIHYAWDCTMATMCYPSQITYNDVTITIARKPRDMANVPVFATGTSQLGKTEDLVESITVQIAGATTRTRKFVFHYDEDNSHRARLDSVVEWGRTDEDQRTLFSSQYDGTRGFSPDTHAAPFEQLRDVIGGTSPQWHTFTTGNTTKDGKSCVGWKCSPEWMTIATIPSTHNGEPVVAVAIGQWKARVDNTVTNTNYNMNIGEDSCQVDASPWKSDDDLQWKACNLFDPAENWSAWRAPGRVGSFRYQAETREVQVYDQEIWKDFGAAIQIYTPGTESTWTESNNWTGLRVGDFNGDGHRDVAYATPVAGPGEWVLRGDEHTTVAGKSCPTNRSCENAGWRTFAIVPADAKRAIVGQWRIREGAFPKTSEYSLTAGNSCSVAATGFPKVDWAACEYINDLSRNWYDAGKTGITTGTYRYLAETREVQIYDKEIWGGYAGVVYTQSPDTTPRKWRIRLGSGDGQLQAASDWANYHPVVVDTFHIDDFNGDGKDDFLFLRNGAWRVLHSNGAQFGAEKSTPYQGAAFSFAGHLGVGDVTGDTLPDIVYVVDASPRRFKVLENCGKDTSAGCKGVGTFRERPWGENTYTNTIGGRVWYGDFNGDRRVDVVYQRASDSSWMVRLTNQNGTGFEPEAVWAGASTPISSLDVWIVDVNGDAKSDLLWRDNTGFWTRLSMGTTLAGGFSEAISLGQAVGVLPYSIRVSDFTGDGKADIFFATSGGTFVKTCGGAGCSDAVPMGAAMAPVSWASLRAADFTGDSRPDLLYVDSSETSYKIRKNVFALSAPESITNRYGGKRIFTYTWSSKWKNNGLPPLRPEVTSIVEDDGRGHLRKTLYGYENGLFHREESVFGGYEKRWVKHSETFVANPEDNIDSPGSCVYSEHLRGLDVVNRPVLVETWSSWDETGCVGALLDRKAYFYDRHGNGVDHDPWIVFLHASDATIFATDSSGEARRVRTEWSYRDSEGALDVYGNLHTKTDLGECPTLEGACPENGDEFINEYGYAPNAHAYIVGPANIVRRWIGAVVGTEKSTQLIRETRNHFDAQPFGTPPTKGLVTTVDEWVFHPLEGSQRYISNTFEFYDNGTLFATQTPLGIRREIEYFPEHPTLVRLERFAARSPFEQVRQRVWDIACSQTSRGKRHHASSRGGGNCGVRCSVYRTRSSLCL